MVLWTHLLIGAAIFDSRYGICLDNHLQFTSDSGFHGKSDKGSEDDMHTHQAS